MNTKKTNNSVKRFNEIEAEIEHLRAEAKNQADDFSYAYEGKRDNSNFLLFVGAIAVVILSAISIKAGVFAALIYALLVYAQHTSAEHHKTKVIEKLAAIDKLRAEQQKLGD
jgi:hypothetical protein